MRRTFGKPKRRGRWHRRCKRNVPDYTPVESILFHKRLWRKVNAKEAPRRIVCYLATSLIHSERAVTADSAHVVLLWVCLSFILLVEVGCQDTAAVCGFFMETFVSVCVCVCKSVFVCVFVCAFTYICIGVALRSCFFHAWEWTCAYLTKANIPDSNALWVPTHRLDSTCPLHVVA